MYLTLLRRKFYFKIFMTMLCICREWNARSDLKRCWRSVRPRECSINNGRYRTPMVYPSNSKPIISLGYSFMCLCCHPLPLVMLCIGVWHCKDNVRKKIILRDWQVVEKNSEKKRPIWKFLTLRSWNFF